MMTLAMAMMAVSVIFLIYTYLGYPILVFLAAQFRTKPIASRPIYPSVTFVIAIWNEETYIQRKIVNILSQSYPAEKIDILFVLDGATDYSRAVVNTWSAQFGNITFRSISQRKGKAAALNLGIAQAKGDIIVLTDARQLFELNTLAKLVSNFADPSVGAVSGALYLDGKHDAVGKSFSSYWDYEKWIRKSESDFYSAIGLTGAVSAIRRELYQPMPEGVILDDLMIPMRISMQGYRVIFDEKAIAFDDATIEYGRELKRKIRTLSGNFQLLSFMPELLSIRKNKCWFQYCSHKITRLLAPLFVGGLLVSNLFVREGIYLFTLIGQILFYSLACVGILTKDLVKKHPLLSVPRTFIMLNYAVCAGFAKFVARRDNVWI